jgi:hypothetical protein
MKSLVKIVLIASIGLLTLLPFSYGSSGEGEPHPKKAKDTYCSSDEGKHYNQNVYTLSGNGRSFFLFDKDAQKYNEKVYSNRVRSRDSGIHRQEQRYKVHRK